MQTNGVSALDERELAALDALEDKLARGRSVHWDQPKVIRGFVARPIEKVAVRDYNDPTSTVEKRVATLRTEDGLEAIWEGPSALERLFEIDGSGVPVIVAYNGEKIGQK